MRVLVTGSRDWECPALAERVLLALVSKHGPFTLVTGGCPTGVDRCFELEAEALGIEVERHPAAWSQGRKAGPARNSAMVALGADLCLTFTPDIGASRGTRDCASKAHRAGIPTWVVGPDGVPRRYASVVRDP